MRKSKTNIFQVLDTICGKEINRQVETNWFQWSPSLYMVSTYHVYIKYIIIHTQKLQLQGWKICPNHFNYVFQFLT
jgi:hypothetical protein